eukprot:13458865-Alexandrium_andersonii.AAC.1
MPLHAPVMLHKGSCKGEWMQVDGWPVCYSEDESEKPQEAEEEAPVQPPEEEAPEQPTEEPEAP